VLRRKNVDWISTKMFISRGKSKIFLGGGNATVPKSHSISADPFPLDRMKLPPSTEI
jgi:hypothetical protein